MDTTTPTAAMDISLNLSNSSETNANISYYPAWLTLLSIISSCTLSPIGIISSILAMCTLWRKVRTENNSFFYHMFIVSLLDFLYHIANLVYSNTLEETWATVISLGMVFPLSLASDLCALTLTAERCLVLKLPHTNLESQTKCMVYSFLAALITLVSCIRIYYVFRSALVLSYLPAWFPDFWEKPSQAIFMFVDVVLPFVLVISMAFFSSMTVLIVAKRRKSKVAPSVTTIQVASIPSNQVRMTEVRSSNRQDVEPTNATGMAEHMKRKKQARNDQVNSTISLVLVLDAFFMLNQIGICLCTIIGFTCGLDSEMYLKCLFLSFVAEESSHAFNFFFYLKFSQIIRQEFVDLKKRVRTKFGFLKC